MQFSTVESIVLPFVMIYRTGQDTVEKTELRMWIMISQRFFFSICLNNKWNPSRVLVTFGLFFFSPSFSKKHFKIARQQVSVCGGRLKYLFQEHIGPCPESTFKRYHYIPFLSFSFTVRLGFVRLGFIPSIPADWWQQN